MTSCVSASDPKKQKLLFFFCLFVCLLVLSFLSLKTEFKLQRLATKNKRFAFIEKNSLSMNWCRTKHKRHLSKKKKKEEICKQKRKKRCKLHINATADVQFSPEKRFKIVIKIYKCIKYIYTHTCGVMSNSSVYRHLLWKCSFYVIFCCWCFFVVVVVDGITVHSRFF